MQSSEEQQKRDAGADSRRARRKVLRSEAWQHPNELTGGWRWLLERGYRFWFLLVALAVVFLLLAKT